jgi:enoyl-CoA hydratase/carnithine racemase
MQALAVAQLDPSVDEVLLRGNGPSFCSGGDLDEFGTARDLDAAHRVRVEQSVGLAVHGLTERLGDRMRAQVHGACIGAGVEVPAFAGHVTATDDAYFCLPELGMGLVPGAGGTVSIPRRIGRWRTAYLALTGKRIGAGTALDWGLVDALR